jgi:hypothetical protein
MAIVAPYLPLFPFVDAAVGEWLAAIRPAPRMNCGLMLEVPTGLNLESCRDFQS